VSFYTGDPDAGGTLIGTVVIEPTQLVPGEMGTATYTNWTVPTIGVSTSIFAVVDRDDTITERDENDNTASAWLVTPDCAVANVLFEELPGEKVDIIARVENRGNDIAENVTVQCLIDGQEVGATTLVKIMPGFAADVLFEASSIVDFDSSQSTVTISVDPSSLLPDPNRDNNILETVRRTTGEGTDVDENGIEDAWQYLYYGDDPIVLDSDDDGDHWTLLHEYWAGTNPLDSNDHLRVSLDVASFLGQDQTAVRWTAVADRRYKIQRSYDLETWEDISNGGLTAADGESTIYDTSTNNHAFYRLSVLEP
jgi:hypothetical protein